jgi:hypothetical protein
MSCEQKTKQKTSFQQKMQNIFFPHDLKRCKNKFGKTKKAKKHI